MAFQRKAFDPLPVVQYHLARLSLGNIATCVLGLSFPVIPIVVSLARRAFFPGEIPLDGDIGTLGNADDAVGVRLLSVGTGRREGIRGNRPYDRSGRTLGSCASDFPDLVARGIGIPQVAVGPLDNLVITPGRRRIVFGDNPCRGDAADLVRRHGEPEGAIGADGDTSGIRAGRRQRIFGEDACRGDLTDLLPAKLGKPEVAIRTAHDT